MIIINNLIMHIILYLLIIWLEAIEGWKSWKARSQGRLEAREGWKLWEIVKCLDIDANEVYRAHLPGNRRICRGASAWIGPVALGAVLERSKGVTRVGLRL